MKVTIELDDNIIYAIGKSVADKVAEEWYFSCDIDKANPPTIEQIKILYQYAFSDGIKYITEKINN